MAEQQQFDPDAFMASRQSGDGRGGAPPKDFDPDAFMASRNQGQGGGGRGGSNGNAPPVVPKTLTQKAIEGTGNFVAGAAKGAVHTAKNLGQLTPPALAASSINKAVSLARVPSKPTALDRADEKVETALKPTNAAQSVGYGAEQLAEFAVPETKLAKVAKIGEAVSNLPKIGEMVTKAAEKFPVLLKSLEEGTKMGTVEYAHTKDLGSAAGAAAAGAGTTAVVGKIGGPFGEWLAKRSRKQYAEIFGSQGGKVSKDIQKTLLGGGDLDLVNKRFTGISAESMERKAGARADELGKQIEQQYAKLDKTSQMKMKPIFDDIYAFMAKNGLSKTGELLEQKEKQKYVSATLDRLNEVVKDLGPEFGTASPYSLWGFRRALEESLYRDNVFGKSIRVNPTTAADKTTDMLSGAIRNVLNSEPTLGALNREFHFWQTAREVLRAKNTKEFGKDTEIKRAAQAGGKFLFGAALGGIAGGGEGYRDSGSLRWERIGEGAAAGLALQAAMTSPAWRSVSAVAKNEIAKLLVKSGQWAGAEMAANEAAKYTTNPADKAKLIALGKKAALGQTISQNLKSTETEKKLLGSVVPPKWTGKDGMGGLKPGTQEPPIYKPSKEVIKQETEKILSSEGAKAGETKGFKKEAKSVYKQVEQQAEQKTAAINAKLEQKKADTYSGAFGIKKSADLTTSEGGAISSYKGSSYAPINQSLYLGGTPSPYVKDIDSAIAKHTLANDAELWRGVKGKYAQQLKSLKVGDTFGNRGYSSSSSAHPISRQFAGKEGVLIKIEAKAGQAGYPFGYNDYEKEYLLPRGLKFRVKERVVDKQGFDNIIVEIVK